LRWFDMRDFAIPIEVQNPPAPPTEGQHSWAILAGSEGERVHEADLQSSESHLKEWLRCHHGQELSSSRNLAMAIA
jgi:hypothetical protein